MPCGQKLDKYFSNLTNQSKKTFVRLLILTRKLKSECPAGRRDDEVGAVMTVRAIEAVEAIREVEAAINRFANGSFRKQNFECPAYRNPTIFFQIKQIDFKGTHFNLTRLSGQEQKNKRVAQHRT